MYSEKQIASLTTKTVNNNKTSCKKKDSGSDEGVWLGSGEVGSHAHVCAGAQRPEGDFQYHPSITLNLIPFRQSLTELKVCL